MLNAIVLAAGSSRRMGDTNKLLLPYKDRPVIVHTIESILAAGIKEIIVVTGHQSQQIAQALTGLPIQFTHNPHHEEGMTGSIRTGVLQATGEGYMICLSDMVFITPAEYTLLRQTFDNCHGADPRCILQPEYQGRKGNPVIFSSAYRDTILRHEEKEGCRSIIRTNSEHVHPVNMPFDHILRDIDSPEDYQALTLDS